MSTEAFLSRWSRRKQAEDEVRVAEDQVVAPKPASDNALPAGAVKNQYPQASSGTAAEGAQPPSVIELPALESLTPQSDFKPFMQSGIASATRNAALKKLFTDPHFNVMDGLDTYIDDYTKSDPIPEEWLKTMWQSRSTLFSPEERAAAEAEDARLAAEARAAALLEEEAKAAAEVAMLPKPTDFDSRVAQDNSR